jgi:hypothetical protein
MPIEQLLLGVNYVLNPLISPAIHPFFCPQFVIIASSKTERNSQVIMI